MPSVQTFVCQACDREWSRPTVRGNHPRRCPGCRAAKRTFRRCAWCDCRGVRRHGTYCSWQCAQNHHQVVLGRDHTDLRWTQCRRCDHWFVQRRRSVFCSDECRTQGPVKEQPPTHGECYECGATYRFGYNQYTQQRYCSKTCSNRVSARMRRARKRAVEYEEVWRSRIFERDGYRCGICGRRCLKGKDVPHPQAPTLDHIVPLAQGGPHTYRNIQTACYLCNVIKADGPGGQLRLIG